MNAVGVATRRAVGLEYASVGLSLLEAGLALWSGFAAGSVALEAFGGDSVIEVLSALVVVGNLRVLVRRRDRDQGSEHRSHRVISGLFYALAAYVVASAAVALTRSVHPRENVLGIVVCSASALITPALALAKAATSRELAALGFSAVARLLRADAVETALCGLLSLSTLGGVVLVATLGWWWADPVASSLVVYFALREGREAWRCDPA